MYKVFYKGTKKKDYNLYISYDKDNRSCWGFDNFPHSKELHLGKCHITLTVYPLEVAQRTGQSNNTERKMNMCKNQIR